MRILILSLFALTACTPAPDPDRPHLQCTVDDTLSFTAENVIRVTPDGGALRIQRADAPTIVRNMLPGETCERVAEINWELTP